MKTLLIVGITLLILSVLLTGVVISPRYVWRYMTRKVVYHQVVEVGRNTPVSGRAPEPDWELSRLNSNLLILVTGGIGNTLLTLAAGSDACRRWGMRPPCVVLETGSDFDYHKISPSKYPGMRVDSISELLPWTPLVVSKSFYTPFLFFHDTKTWNSRSIEDFPVSTTVLQVTEFRDMMGVSDEAFDYVRRSLNPNLFSYINSNYKFTPGCMALHLRMGQPTDDFMPPHPTRENIIDFISRNHPDKIMIFADSRESAEKHVSGIQFPCMVEWVGDTGIVECLMIGMCSCALISHSTFSVVGSRLGKLKNVEVCVGRKSSDYIKVMDEAWKIEYQDRGYQK